MSEATITIEKRKYDMLVRDSLLLDCLLNENVDLWSGYNKAYMAFNKRASETSVETPTQTKPYFPDFPSDYECIHCGAIAYKIQSRTGTHTMSFKKELCMPDERWYEAVYECSVCGKHTGLQEKVKE